MDLETFRQQLDFFAAQYGIISQSEWQQFIQDEVMPEGVLLTFDDGLKDHVRFVAPELEARGLFGIFFVSTDPLEGRALSAHMAHFMLAYFPPEKTLKSLIDALGPSRKIIDRVATQAYSSDDHGAIEKLVKRLVNWSVDLGPNHRDAVEQVFRNITGMSGREFTLEWNLSESETLALGSNFEVGSHTQSHRLLSRLPRRSQEEELSKSKSILEHVIGTPVVTFCFPYGGRESYSDETLDLLSETGYSAAISVESRVISQESSKLALPRFDCNEFLKLG